MEPPVFAVTTSGTSSVIIMVAAAAAAAAAAAREGDFNCVRRAGFASVISESSGITITSLRAVRDDVAVERVVSDSLAIFFDGAHAERSSSIEIGADRSSDWPRSDAAWSLCPAK